MKRSTLKLKQIDRYKAISNDNLSRDYIHTGTPVVIENLMDNWGAKKTWTLDHFKNSLGDIDVPLYDNRKPVSAANTKFNEPHLRMPFAKYIDLLQEGPTPYRIFLFNLLKEVPGLQKDFSFPKDMDLKFLSSLPMLFFGGENSKVFMHYDIDYANILHFHFHGKKRCILYPPSQTKYLYKMPNALLTHPDIDFANPDLDRFPALAKSQGYVTELNHGDALYMPEGWWHQMTYLTPGFSMSLRALSNKKRNLAKAAYNIAVMRHIDTLMRNVVGEPWLNYKKQAALHKSNKAA